MKKYLFLLFLFVIYLFLKFQNKQSPVLSYNDISNSSVINLDLKFNTGINSNKLIYILDSYDDEYFVYMINYNNNFNNVTCKKIEKCINDIYEMEDNKFSYSYITNGFLINDIKLLAYKDNILPFLEKNNISYDINKNSLNN